MSDLSSFFPTNTEATIFQLVITIWLLSEIIGTAIIPRIRRGGSVIKRKDRFSGLYIFATIFPSSYSFFLLCKGQYCHVTWMGF